MALSPEIEIAETEEEQASAIDLLALKVYRFDFETNRLTNELISGLDAVKQAVLLILDITRYAHPIYSSDTGNELHELLTNNEVTIAFKIMEIKRLITEALIYDERIEGVYNFDIQHIDDAFHVSFTVGTIAGEINLEEVLAA